MRKSKSKMGKEHKDQLKELKNKRFDYKTPKDIVISTDIKEVTSEAEYWEKHAIYLKRLKKFSNSFKKMIIHPDEYIREYETIMEEMLAYGLVNIEWVNEKRQKIYNTLNYPSTFRNWIIKKISRSGKKIKKN